MLVASFFDSSKTLAVLHEAGKEVSDMICMQCCRSYRSTDPTVAVRFAAVLKYDIEVLTVRSNWVCVFHLCSKALNEPLHCKNTVAMLQRVKSCHDLTRRPSQHLLRSGKGFNWAATRKNGAEGSVLWPEKNRFPPSPLDEAQLSSLTLVLATATARLLVQAKSKHLVALQSFSPADFSMHQRDETDFATTHHAVSLFVSKCSRSKWRNPLTKHTLNSFKKKFHDTKKLKSISPYETLYPPNMKPPVRSSSIRGPT